MRKFNNIEVFSKLKKAKWNPEGRSIEADGVNCYSFVIQFLNETGHGVPLDDDITGDYTYQNIKAKWSKDNIKVCEDIINYHIEAGHIEEIPIGKIELGSLLIVELKGNTFPAVYAGNNRIMSMVKNGSYQFHLTPYKILRAFKGTKI
jgi:hypothetical protein